MSEFTPPGRGAKMTKSQVKKYIKDLKKKRKIAQEKLDQAIKDGIFEREAEELKNIENLIDEL